VRRLLLVELVAVATLSAVGAVGFHRIFAGRSFLVPVLGAAVLPVAVSAAGHLRRWHVSTSLLASLVAFVLYVMYAALGPTMPNLVPTASTFAELGRGLTNGWADLLSISLPARADPQLRVVACAVVWTGALLGAELAQRSRHLIAPAIPPLGAYVYTLFFAAGQPASPLIVPLAETAATLLLLLSHANRWAVIEPGGLRARPVRGDEEAEAVTYVPADRRVLVGLPIIGAALVVAAVASSMPTSALRAAFDPRHLRPQDVVSREVVSPLAGVRRQLRLDPPRKLFTLQIDRLSDALLVPRVAVATLDRFDGATWTSTGRFSQVGSVLPRDEKPTTPTRAVGQRYAIEALGGVWLPAAEQPVAIDGGDKPLAVQFDAASGNLITDRGSLAGLDYSVTSEVSTATPAELDALVPGSGKAFAVTTDTEGMPAEVRDLARTWSQVATSPYSKLQAIEKTLKEGYGYSQDVAQGHSYGRLVDFLTTTRVGYAEQFAATFAVMARSLGIPSRLVVGYLTTDDTSGGGDVRADGVITTHEAHVWAETYFEGAGWVSFDPTPARVPTTPPPKTKDETAANEGGLFEEQAPPNEVAPQEPAADHEAGGFPTRLLVVAAFLLLVLALPFLLIGLKALVRRRRRRRARNPAEQVLGAWAEVVDRLLEVGVPLEKSLTAREVAGRSIEFVSPGAQRLLYEMVPLVTAALFAPSGPSPERAALMYELVEQFGREIVTNRPMASRMVAALNPKPLLYARR
jgi:transglutaminase-like putative cysteine protease